MNGRNIDKLTTKSYLKLFDYDKMDDLIHTLLKTNPKLFVVIMYNYDDVDCNPVGCYMLYDEAINHIMCEIDDIILRRREEYNNYYYVDDENLYEKIFLSKDKLRNKIIKDNKWNGETNNFFIIISDTYKYTN